MFVLTYQIKKEIIGMRTISTFLNVARSKAVSAKKRNYIHEQWTDDGLYSEPDQSPNITFWAALHAYIPHPS